jgi:hypothetical protein
VSNQNCSTENSVKVLDRNEEEIRKEMCRIFMEDDDFDIYMREWGKERDAELKKLHL